MSTQRLLIMLISINLIISMAIGITINPRNFSDSDVTDYSNRLDYNALNLIGEEESTSAESLNEEGTFGSAGSMGKNVFSLFIKGLDPLPFKNIAHEDDVIKIIIILLTLFRALIGIIIILEVIMLLKNSKSS